MAAISCNGGDNSSTSNNDTIAIDSYASDHPLERETYASMDPEVNILVGSLNQMTLNLYALITNFDHDLNGFSVQSFLVSPYALATTMAMTSRGAGGETLSQFSQIFSDLDQTRIHRLFNQMDSELNNHFQTNAMDLNGFLSTTVVWGQSGYQVFPDFLSCFPKYYGADIQALDFLNAPVESRNEIEQWLWRQHGGNGNIPEEFIPHRSRLVFAADVSANLQWSHPFDSSLTAPGSFYGLDSLLSAVDMMKQTGDFEYANDNGTKIVDLPLGSGRLSMLLILPELDSFTDIETTLGLTVVNHYLANLQTTTIALSLPRGQNLYENNFAGHIQSLGALDAIDENTADFSRANPVDRLFLENARFTSTSEWDESGITFSSSAIALLKGDDDPLPPWNPPSGFIVIICCDDPPLAVPEVVFDHPFIVIVHDTVTGVITLIGRVG